MPTAVSRRTAVESCRLTFRRRSAPFTPRLMLRSVGALGLCDRERYRRRLSTSLGRLQQGHSGAEGRNIPPLGALGGRARRDERWRAGVSQDSR